MALNKTTKTEVVETKGATTPPPPPPPPEFDNLVSWVMGDGLTVFLLDHDNPVEVMEVIEAKKYKVYYLLAATAKNQTTTTTNKVGGTNTTTTLKPEPQFYKVVNNLLGRSVHKVNLGEAFTGIRTGIKFAVPKIPFELIQKVDSFFRHIDDALGTEAIVLLTYDSTVEEGKNPWGFVVPDQKNTSVACNYDPPSVQERKPPQAMIAGSIHSHPSMPAYASGVDEHDQIAFDGIHITIGWSTKTNNASEYHIEAQMHEARYEFKPEDIFQYHTPNGLTEDELKELDAYVKKDQPVATSWSTGGYGSYGYNATGAKGKSTGSGGKFPSGITIDLPKTWPDPSEDLVIGVVTNVGAHQECPFCTSLLTSIDISGHRCLTCMLYIAEKTDSVDDIIKNRKSEGLNVLEFEKANKAYFCVQGSPDAKKVNLVSP